MVRKYSCWFLLVLVFCLVSACSGNDVSTSNNQGNNQGGGTDTGLEDTSDTSGGPEDVQEEDTVDLCALIDCVAHSSCDSELGQCVCDEGYDWGVDEHENAACQDQCQVMRCGPNTAGCEAGVCLCIEGYEPDENGVCAPVATGLCVDREESCQEYATCDPETGDCACNDGYIEGADENGVIECIDRCVTMRCGPNTAGCEAGVCLCAEGFESVEGRGCQPIATGLCKDREEPCQEDATCRPETGECVCDFGEKDSENETEVPVCKGICDAMKCSANSTCDPDIGSCVCDEGFVFDEDEGCVEI